MLETRGLHPGPRSLSREVSENLISLPKEFIVHLSSMAMKAPNERAARTAWLVAACNAGHLESPLSFSLCF